MLNGGLVAGRGNWGDSETHAASDCEDAQAALGGSTDTDSELVWTRAGHSLSSRPISVFLGPG
jgi:hypothetical protein